MTKRIPRAILVVLVVVTVLAVTTTAAAFCRKTTAGGDECNPAPDALPLYWRKTCVAVRVVVDSELARDGRMTQARATAIVERATATWNTVQCNGRSIAIEIADVARATCADQPGTRSEIHFSASRAEPGVLGATDVTFDGESGSISLARTNVPDVYDDLDAKDEQALDARVEGVVRHELGHFLGLAHSDDEKAVMAAAYDPARADGLTDDDVKAICDTYDPAHPIGAGCTFSPRPSTSSAATIAFALALFASLVCHRRRQASAICIASLFLLSTANAEAAGKKKRTSPAKPKTTAISHDNDDAALLRNEETLAGGTPMVAYVVEDRPAPPSAPPRDEPPPSVPKTDASPPAELWLGARYRASVLPSAVVSPIAKTNHDLLFHSAAIELSIRRPSFSLVPAVTFGDLTTRDLLVGKSGGDLASSFSHVKSDLYAIAASASFVWSLALSRRVSVELGFEVGVATTIGSMTTTWVHEAADGPLAYGGRRFAPCATVNDGFGCRPQDHEAGATVHVGGASERGPVILPWVSLPLTGVRMKISDDVGARIGIGASITGIWAGVAIDYGVRGRSGT